MENDYKTILLAKNYFLKYFYRRLHEIKPMYYRDIK
jgi:hypothetical protein